MKKIYVFIILCALILCVGGCGKATGSSDGNTEGEGKSEETSVSGSDGTDKNKETADIDNAGIKSADEHDESEEAEDHLLDVYIKSNYEESCPEEIAYFTAVVTTSYPEITLGNKDAKRYPKLQAALAENSWESEKVLQDYKTYL